MKIIIFLAALMLSQNIESREDFYVIDCGRDEILFPMSTFPFGVSLSDREICACSKNNLIIDKILKGIKYELEL